MIALLQNAYSPLFSKKKKNAYSPYRSISHMVDETKSIVNSSDWVENQTFKEANFMAYNVTKWALLLTIEGNDPIPISSLPDFCLRSQDREGFYSLSL